MKSIVLISSIALLTLSSISPCLAKESSFEEINNQTSSSQPLPNEADSVQVAFRLKLPTIKKVPAIIKTIKKETDKQQRDEDLKNKREKAALVRQQRMAEYQKKQEERRALIEAKRQKEQDYISSLTPEQKTAYLEQKRAQRAAMLDFWASAFIAISSGGGNSSSPKTSTRDEYRYEPVYTPATQPSSQPNNSINPFYGSCHGGSFYGC
jgi:hypothetical protein